MAELRRIGEACGFANVRTFIASGNLLFDSDLGEAEAQARIEAGLEAFFGKSVAVFVRTATELAATAAANPFADDKPSRVMAHFIAWEPDAAMLAEARDVTGERMALGTRSIIISYGEGIGKTRLKLPAVRHGTARNMNSVAKLSALLG